MHASLFREKPRVQPKLRVNAPNDAFEQEADRMADRVVGQGTSGEVMHNFSAFTQVPVSRKCAACEAEDEVQRKEDEEDIVQAKSADGGFTVDGGFESQLNSRKGGGAPLADNVRGQMEQSFGADFGGIRIHTGGEAAGLSRQINAKAFTHGKDVFFGAGEYQPQTAQGKRLLAHELTHTIQQGGGKLQRSPSLIQRAGPTQADRNIEGVYRGSSRYPSLVFFNYDSDAVPAQERTKIRDFSQSAPTAALRLVGTASEEGNAAYNRDLATRRINAVDAALRAESHTGSLTHDQQANSGIGSIDYRFKRHVEMVPDGQAMIDPNCGTGSAVVNCNTHSDYAQFNTRLTEGQTLVSNAVNAINRDPSKLSGLFLRFFGSDASGTVDDVRDNLKDLLDHMRNNVQSRHECHNNCDPTCVGGTIAYNSGNGSAARMTLCNNFFAGNASAQRDTLIHESVHGTQGMARGGRSAPDVSYRWARLFGTPTRRVMLPTADAVRNPDSLLFFVREANNPGDTARERVPDDSYVGLSPAREQTTHEALAHAQWWMVKARQYESQTYSKATDQRRNSQWSGNANTWYVRVAQSLANHFGTTAPMTMATAEDRRMYAAVSDRLLLARLMLNGSQKFEQGVNPVTTYTPSTRSFILRSDFFTLNDIERIKDLIRALFAARTDVSAGLVSEYVEFTDEVRRIANVSP